jgi:cell division protein FtsI (penicillin-binding protein 3)
MARRKIVKKRNSTQTAFTRFLFIVALFTIWIGGIGVRLVHLQVNQSEELRKKATSQRSNTFNDKVLRGTIFDRSGERALAISLKVKSLFADPTKVVDFEKTSTSIAAIIKENPHSILAELKKAKSANRQFVWLSRRLDENIVKQIDALEIAGLGWKEEFTRTYPYKTLAANVLGFANSEDVGQAGIELSQEKYLRGDVIKGIQKKTRDGRVFEREEVESRREPKDINLTIDYSIQHKMDKALEKGVIAANAKSGTAVAMVPSTGEILGMSSYPTYDPNKFGEANPESLTNKAIQNFYTPGSTFKLVTYGASMQEGLLKPESQIDCSKGSIEVASHKFEDSHKIGIVSATDAFAASSNVAAVKTGLSLGREKFHDYAKRFGFGDTTGIELPAETGGIFRSVDNWNPDSLASMSLGYEIGVTTLQTASAFATIANDGIRVKPHIIKYIKDSNGQIFDQPEIVSNQAISTEAARDMKKLMTRVVSSGTGVKAQLDGYAVAGKTGTAWKYDDKLKKINENKFVSSFGGFAPANNPAVVIVIVLDEPRGAYRDGGHVAAPIFRDIAEQILPELGAKPDGTQREEDAEVIAEDTKKHAVEKSSPTKENIKSVDKKDSKVNKEAASSDLRERIAKNENKESKDADAREPKSKNGEEKTLNRPRKVELKTEKKSEPKSEKHKT